jgi:hypothetical protein
MRKKNSPIRHFYLFLKKLWRRYRIASRPLGKEEEEEWQTFGM